MDGISLSVQKRSEVLGKEHFVDQAVKLAGKSYNMQRDCFLSSQCRETFSYGCRVTILTNA